jgi:hypothetical protein
MLKEKKKRTDWKVRKRKGMCCIYSALELTKACCSHPAILFASDNNNISNKKNSHATKGKE